MSPGLTAAKIRQYSKKSLFADKTWRWSPSPWPLPSDVCQWIDKLGKAAVAFYQGIDLLYRRSWKGDSLIRNGSLYAPWIAEYYDGGKPAWLIEHGRSDAVQKQIPLVLRPDLIPHAEGIALTEWDSVPGGIGLTAHLEVTFEMMKEPRMVISFRDALVWAARHLGGEKAHMVIAVSEEANTYLPEMEWICHELGKLGLSIQACSPDDLSMKNGFVFFHHKKISLIYRFWELFDYKNVKIMPALARLVEEGGVVVTPPMKHNQEEKLSLALFHHHRLQSFWEENVSKQDLQILRSAIPESWVMDPREVPPGAFLDGPLVQGQRITSWSDLSKASKKERKLVLKASGFHETAWGARSVIIGDDVSANEWSAALAQAIKDYPNPVFILQEFKKPRSFTHKLISAQGESIDERGRVRLSPYFFITDKTAKWSGTLTSFCPLDKKIIHGMKDGSLIPCIET